MAKKTKTTKTTTTHSSDNSRIVKFCAFWAMAIAALLYIFSGVINVIIKIMTKIGDKAVPGALNTLVSVFSLLGGIATIIAIALPAYNYVRGRGRGWKAFYIVCLIVFALGVVLSMLPW